MSQSPLGVLILHGFTSSLDCVSGIDEPLAARGIPTRVPVLRGHGETSPEALRGVRWTDWLADGEAALQALRDEVEQVVIVGHSMGTLVAVMLAAEHAEEAFVDSLVLAAPAVQLSSPLAPGKPFSFLIPVLRRVLRKWDMPPNYADASLAQYDTNYEWAPMESVMEVLAFSEAARKRLPEVKQPVLIIQSRNDTTVAPDSAEVVYSEVATPADQKRIVWFERTEHEMFRDCEREDAVQAVVEFVRARAAATAGLSEQAHMSAGQGAS
jgi:carboxylesterase